MEGEPKITTIEKIKNPKRVEQGKRLAAISREAKARKAKERQEQQEQESEILPYLLLVPVTVIGVAAFGGYCYWKKEESKKEEKPKKEEEPKTVSRLERL